MLEGQFGHKQGRTGHCGNCHKTIFENARLFIRMCGILKIFSENLRLFSIRVFQGLQGFLKTFLVASRLF
jgi:hypothetical protein